MFPDVLHQPQVMAKTVFVSQWWVARDARDNLSPHWLALMSEPESVYWWWFLQHWRWLARVVSSRDDACYKPSNTPSTSASSHQEILNLSEDPVCLEQSWAWCNVARFPVNGFWHFSSPLIWYFTPPPPPLSVSKQTLYMVLYSLYSIHSLMSRHQEHTIVT